MPEPEANSSDAAWERLSESDRALLREAALAEILACGEEYEQRIVARRGAGSMLVDIRAKRLARKGLCAQ